MAVRVRRPDTAFANAPAAGQKRPRQTADQHLRWIRTLPCIITGSFPVDAAHIRFAAPGYGKRETGMAEKPDDAWVVPLSPEKHREQHSMSEAAFWDKHNIDPCRVALALFHASGDDDRAFIIINHARS